MDNIGRLVSLIRERHPEWDISETGNAVTLRWRGNDACSVCTGPYGGSEGLLQYSDGRNLVGYLNASDALWHMEMKIASTARRVS